MAKNDQRITDLKNALVGKTIEKIDAKAINIIHLWFTDGTSIDLEVEAFGWGLYGIIACDCDRPKKEAECEPTPKTRAMKKSLRR